MKIVTTLAVIFTFTSCFAQQDMFWNDYSNFNPAMSGFQYQQHGTLNYSSLIRGNSNAWNTKELSGNYNMRLAGKHGVGLNFSGYSNFFYNSSNVVANYNYQFNLDKAGQLSAGIGAGVNVVNITSFFIPESLTHLQLNLGVAHKWKGLTTGFSVQNMAQPRVQLQPGFFSKTKPVYTVHAAYDVNLGKRFQLTPRAIFTHNYGYTELNTALTLTLDRKFSIGALYSVNHQFGIHAGWDIKEKFRVAYSLITPFSTLGLNNLNFARHQFTLGFQLR